MFFLDTGVLLVPRSRRSPTEFQRRICRKVCFRVAGKVSGLSGFDLLLEERVIDTLKSDGQQFHQYQQSKRKFKQ